MKIKPLLIVIMRVTFIQVAIILTLFVSAIAKSGRAQAVLNQKISLKITNTDVGAVLQSIEKISDVKFLYSSAIIESSRKVSVSVNNQSLGKVLGKILPPLQLSFEVNAPSPMLLTSNKTNK